MQGQTHSILKSKPTSCLQDETTEHRDAHQLAQGHPGKRGRQGLSPGRGAAGLSHLQRSHVLLLLVAGDLDASVPCSTGSEGGERAWRVQSCCLLTGEDRSRRQPS